MNTLVDKLEVSITFSKDDPGDQQRMTVLRAAHGVARVLKRTAALQRAANPSYENRKIFNEAETRFVELGHLVTASVCNGAPAILSHVNFGLAIEGLVQAMDAQVAVHTQDQIGFLAKYGTKPETIAALGVDPTTFYDPVTLSGPASDLYLEFLGVQSPSDQSQQAA